MAWKLCDSVLNERGNSSLIYQPETKSCQIHFSLIRFSREFEGEGPPLRDRDKLDR